MSSINLYSLAFARSLFSIRHPTHNNTTKYKYNSIGRVGDDDNDRDLHALKDETKLKVLCAPAYIYKLDEGDVTAYIFYVCIYESSSAVRRRTSE